jgi:hypothetical protein
MDNQNPLSEADISTVFDEQMKLCMVYDDQ